MSKSVIRHWAAYSVKSSLDRVPVLYVAYLRAKYCRRAFGKRIISRDTDLCIEGYNRSANSFAVKVFRDANDSGDCVHKLATHAHASSQVRRALAYRVPTMVLIREPLATVASQKALAVQLKQVDDAMAYPAEIFLRMYMNFYQRLLPLADQILVVTFEQATSDFSRVIQRLNAKFATSYEAIEHTDDKESEIFEKGRVHLSPSRDRNAIKRSLKAELDELARSKLMEQARELHRRFSSFSTD